MEDPSVPQTTEAGGDTAPARQESAVRQFSEKEVALLKRTICQDATDEELSMFIQNCKRYGLDPFTGQIHAVKRWDSSAGRKVMSVQVGIDGFRLIADRTGKWEGTIGPYWCGKDGEWTEPWLSDGYPAAAKVGVLRSDFSEPRWGTARWGAYVATKKNGDPNYMWHKMPAHMLAKCAEALALRAAFPNDLSGLYTDAEMAQAGDQEKRTYDGPAPEKVSDAEVVHDGRKSNAGDTYNSDGSPDTTQWEAPTGNTYQVDPNAAGRLDDIHSGLDSKEGAELLDAIGKCENLDWPAREAEVLSQLLDYHRSRAPDPNDDLGIGEPTEDPNEQPDSSTDSEPNTPAPADEDMEIVDYDTFPTGFPGARFLKDAGIDTPAHLSQRLDQDEPLTEIDGIGETRAEKIKTNLEDLRNGEFEDELPF